MFCDVCHDMMLLKLGTDKDVIKHSMKTSFSFLSAKANIPLRSAYDI